MGQLLVPLSLHEFEEQVEGGQAVVHGGTVRMLRATSGGCSARL